MGLRIFRLALRESIPIGLRQTHPQSVCYFRNDILLENENVGQLERISIPPQLAIVRDIHQLRPDTEIVAASTNLTGEDCTDIELAAHGGKVAFAPPIAERGTSGNDSKVRQAGEVSGDARRYLVAQVIRIAIVLNIDKRQYRERLDAFRVVRPASCGKTIAHAADVQYRENNSENHRYAKRGCHNSPNPAFWP